MPYTAISAVPVTLYVIKKKYLYFYLDDVAKQQFLTVLKKYPEDKLLRRYFIEQDNWKDYVHRSRAQSELGGTKSEIPKHIKNDVQLCEEMKIDLKRKRRLKSVVTLPKIDKKNQIKERLMSWY